MLLRVSIEVKIMGDYVNPEPDNFEMSLGSEIYIDKSNLIAKTNRLIRTKQRFICISRPRRFGKTMAADMLAAYYSRGEDAHALFKNLNIATHPTYEKHLNQYTVLMINMQDFLSQAETVADMLKLLRSKLIEELQNKKNNFLTKILRSLGKNLQHDNIKDFMRLMKDVYRNTKQPFIILIDEWDCVFRANKVSADDHEIYLDFLRLWLKDKSYVGLAYMTGILPIKKYGEHSALNMFEEYSMTEPSQFLDYFGFKEAEVKELTLKYDVDMSEMAKWYNGYFVDLGAPIYNPKSVTSSLMRKRFSSYWNKTETYEALKDYIMLDFDELREKVTLMLSGASITIGTGSFANDMTTFDSADDVLTLLIHLGYLSYNFEEKTVRIPNEEVKDEFVTSIKSLKWTGVVDALRDSDKLLQAIWNEEVNIVAAGVQKVHEQNTSILKYNDENALSCVISLALYSAKNYYTIIRELPSGKGYADLVFIPYKKSIDKPAIVVELKWNKTVQGAIAQIKERNYISALKAYQGDILLVGINYEKDTKHHECIIESWKI